MRYGPLCFLSFLALGCVSGSPVLAATSSTMESVVTSTASVIELTPTSTQEQITTPVILQMADGRFYAPASGRTGATREELLHPQVSTTTPAITIPPVVPATPDSAQVVSSTTTTLPIFPLRTALEVGREMLREIAVATSTVHTYPSLTSRVTLTFALWDSANVSTGTMTTSSIQLVQKSISLKDLQKKGIRGLMTPLQNQGVVVGVYYPLVTEVGTKKKKKYQARSVVYTPYSDALDTPQMVQLGKAWLHRVTQDVYEELRQQHVASRAFPGKLIVDAIQQVLPQSIASIEHIDYRALDVNGEQGLDPFYIMFAANSDNAFGYSLSPAGARGLAQFIPSTYASIVRLRPDAYLEPDFMRAMEHPKTSLKAGVVYLDTLLLELPAEARDRYVQGDTQANEFVVAAYNGGPARISRAVADWEALLKDGPKRVVALQQKVSQAASSVKLLTKQIKNEKKAKAKTALKKKLVTAQANHASLQNQLTLLKKTVLRDETIEYILKYRYVAAWLRRDAGLVPTIATASIHSESIQ